MDRAGRRWAEASLPGGPVPRNVTGRGRAQGGQVRWPSLLYRGYERKLVADLAGAELPNHVGWMLEGNRRWAREKGFAAPNEGHRAGAAHIDELLGWCS